MYYPRIISCCLKTKFYNKKLAGDIDCMSSELLVNACNEQKWKVWRQTRLTRTITWLRQYFWQPLVTPTSNHLLLILYHQCSIPNWNMISSLKSWAISSLIFSKVFIISNFNDPTETCIDYSSCFYLGNFVLKYRISMAILTNDLRSV